MHLCMIISCVIFLINVACVSSTFLFGFTIKDAVYMSSTSSFENKGGVSMKEDVHWITNINTKNILIGLIGDYSDCDYLRTELETANTEHMLSYDGKSMKCKSLAHLCRNIIAKHLRSASPLQVEALIGGIDTPVGWTDADDYRTPPLSPELYWVDGVGSLQKVSYAAHGSEAAFFLSTMDNLEREYCTSTSPPTRRVSIPSSNNDSTSQNNYTDKDNDDTTISSIQKLCSDKQEKEVRNILKTSWEAVRKRSTSRMKEGSCHVKCVSRDRGAHQLDNI
jgi:20S proteasome alpha/beta subunit